jgi:sterol desaturase/sphingolipid hydroxylase (fatty acid hydroxylase superfamily)
MYEVISFWTAYLIGGYFLDDHKHNTFDLYKTLIINLCISFLLIPITDKIPILIEVPEDFVGYIIRVVLALFIGDLWLYATHRLLHRYLYQFHKQHHIYTKPHALTGLYAHPIEYILSNHLSMIIPLKIIARHEFIALESAVVAVDILISHMGRNANYPSAKYHTLHHERHDCNYSFAYISDMIFGTYISE